MWVSVVMVVVVVLVDGGSLVVSVSVVVCIWLLGKVSSLCV